MYIPVFFCFIIITRERAFFAYPNIVNVVISSHQDVDEILNF